MSTAPIDRTFYADPSGINALRRDARAHDPAALKNLEFARSQLRR